MNCRKYGKYWIFFILQFCSTVASLSWKSCYGWRWSCKYPNSEESEESEGSEERKYDIVLRRHQSTLLTTQWFQTVGWSCDHQDSQHSQDNWAPPPPAGDFHQPRPPLTPGPGGQAGQEAGWGGERRRDDAGEQEARLGVWPQSTGEDRWARAVIMSLISHISLLSQRVRRHRACVRACWCSAP